MYSRLMILLWIFFMSILTYALQESYSFSQDCKKRGGVMLYAPFEGRVCLSTRNLV